MGLAKTHFLRNVNLKLHLFIQEKRPRRKEPIFRDSLQSIFYQGFLPKLFLIFFLFERYHSPVNYLIFTGHMLPTTMARSYATSCSTTAQILPDLYFLFLHLSG